MVDTFKAEMDEKEAELIERISSADRAPDDEVHPLLATPLRHVTPLWVVVGRF